MPVVCSNIHNVVSNFRGTEGFSGRVLFFNHFSCLCNEDGDSELQGREFVLYIPGMTTHAISLLFHLIMSIGYLVASILLTLTSLIFLRTFAGLNELSNEFWILTASAALLAELIY